MGDITRPKQVTRRNILRAGAACLATTTVASNSTLAEQGPPKSELPPPRILAQNFTTITRAPREGRHWVNTPGIVALSSGNLLATAQVGDWNNRVRGWKSRILRSCDDGTTWSLLCEQPWYEASLMVISGELYMLIIPWMSTRTDWMGDNVSITKSTDEGKTWAEPVVLFEGPYWTPPMGKAIQGNTCYIGLNVNTWSGAPNNGVAVMAGDLTKDLMDPRSWRLSNTVFRPETPDGLTCKLMAKKGNAWRAWKRDGWLEANVVNVNGRLRVMSRCVIDGYATANIGGICDLEDDGTKLELSFAQFAAVPGGQCKFYIKCDPVSRMFWMASNVPTDSQEMVLDWDRLRANGRFNGGPGNERRILMLYYSIDALNWFPAGCIAKGEGMLQSFMYPTFDFQGDDIVLISRSSQAGHNQHDADTATFHRIRDFRSLALDLFPR